jgi:hypothetical protein
MNVFLSVKNKIVTVHLRVFILWNIFMQIDEKLNILVQKQIY